MTLTVSLLSQKNAINYTLENSLKLVPSDVLHGLNELKILRLNGNTISKIETGAFRDMPSLKEIQVKNSKADEDEHEFSH